MVNEPSMFELSRFGCSVLDSRNASVKRPATSENVPSDMCANGSSDQPAHSRSLKSSLGLVWITKNANVLNADNEYSDRAARRRKFSCEPYTIILVMYAGRLYNVTIMITK